MTPPARGARVSVPLGRRVVTGVVVGPAAPDAPAGKAGEYDTKDLIAVLDDEAFVPPAVVDLASLSAPLAAARRIDSGYLEYLFAMVLTVAILVGIKVIGALLVEALVVVPAAAARNLARSTRSYLVGSVAVAVIAG